MPSSRSGPATGWYVEIGSPGVRVGGGYYHAAGPDLARIRTAIDTPHSGEELERIVSGLESDGFEIRGDQLKTTPRGYAADHPRIDLLRYKSLSLGKNYGFKNLNTPDLADRVRDDWRSLRPLVEWVAARLDLARWLRRRPKPCDQPCRDARSRSLLNHRRSRPYSGFRRVAIVRSSSQCAAIETSLPSSSTR